MIEICEIPDFKTWYDTLLNLKDVELKFTPSGIEVCMIDELKAFLVKSLLKTEVKNTCVMAINLSPIKTVKGKVTVFWDVNALIFKSGIVEYICQSIVDKQIKTIQQMPKINHTVFTVDIPKDQISEMLKVSEKEEDIKFISEGHNLLVSNDTNNIRARYENVLETGAIDCILNYTYMGNVIKSMKPFDKLSIKLGVNCPAVFNLSNDMFEVEYWISPRIVDQ